MAKKKSQSSTEQKPSARQERLKAALKANIARRKAQTRSRKDRDTAADRDD